MGAARSPCQTAHAPRLRGLGGVGGALRNMPIGARRDAGRTATRVRELFRHLVTADGTRSVLTRDELVQVGGGAVALPVGDADRRAPADRDGAAGRRQHRSRPRDAYRQLAAPRTNGAPRTPRARACAIVAVDRAAMVRAGRRAACCGAGRAHRVPTVARALPGQANHGRGGVRPGDTADTNRGRRVRRSLLVDRGDRARVALIVSRACGVRRRAAAPARKSN